MNEVLMLMLTTCILDRSVLRESLNNTKPLCLASDSYPWINCKEKAHISDSVIIFGKYYCQAIVQSPKVPN